MKFNNRDLNYVGSFFLNSKKKIIKHWFYNLPHVIVVEDDEYNGLFYIHCKNYKNYTYENLWTQVVLYDDVITSPHRYLLNFCGKLDRQDIGLKPDKIEDWGQFCEVEYRKKKNKTILNSL